MWAGQEREFQHVCYISAYVGKRKVGISATMPCAGEARLGPVRTT